MKYRNEKELDPKTATKVYALTASPLVETIRELLPENKAGLTIKILLKTPGKILDYSVSVKVGTNEGKTSYEAEIEGFTDVIQGAAIDFMLAAAFELVLLSLPITGTVAAIGAAVGTGAYLAFEYDSQVKPALKAIGEFESYLANKAIHFFHAQDTAKITNPVSRSQFNVLTVQNDNDGKTQISYIPGSSRPALAFDDVAKAILDYKQSSPSPNSVFFKYPQTLISLPDGKYPALIGTNKAEVLDGSFYTQPIEIYAGDDNDTLKGGIANDHHIPGQGDDLMEDKAGFDRYYIDSKELGGGKKTIDDKDQKGEIQVNAIPRRGSAKPVKSKEVNAPMWLLDDDDVSIFLTRTKAGKPDENGEDLTLTFDETLASAKDSVTVKGFNFTIGEQFGIKLGGSDASCWPSSPPGVCWIQGVDNHNNIIMHYNTDLKRRITAVITYNGNDYIRASNAQVTVKAGKGDDTIICGDVDKDISEAAEVNNGVNQGVYRLYSRYCNSTESTLYVIISKSSGENAQIF